MLSPAFLDELRQRTTLSALIQRTVPLKKAGREWKACCPFHNEKSPSFTVNDEKGFYHCFGCGAHGDCIRWMTDQLGLTFMDVVKELAAAAGMEVPAPDPRTAEREKVRSGAVDIMARAQDFFASSLASGDPGAGAARNYLAARGIEAPSISKFGIGYAPHVAGTTQSPLSEICSTVPPAELEKLGLVRLNPDTNEPRDFFRRRIMIPIHDARGNVIAFGGRINGDGEPKYLNSPDTPIFDKGRTLFNLHRAAPAARAKGQLVIVEGYMDVIGLDCVGIDFAVAPNGTALTEAQLALAWRLVDVPVVCFDGDVAGRRAAVRAAGRAIAMMEPGKSLRFAALPDGKDPDDLARESGLEAVNAMLESALSIGDVLWRDLLDRFDVRDPDERAALTASIRDLVGTIRNEDVRASYAGHFGQMYENARGRLVTPARTRDSSDRRHLAQAVEDALVLGILRQALAFEPLSEFVESLPWRRDEAKRLVTVLSNAHFDAIDANIAVDDEFVAAAIEKAGLSGFVAHLRRQNVLRMPFLDETDPERARRQLFAALRANFA